MAHRLSVSLYLSAIAISLNIADPIRTAAAKGAILTGKAAMGDWTSDAPGIMLALPDGAYCVLILFSLTLGDYFTRDFLRPR